MSDCLSSLILANLLIYSEKPEIVKDLKEVFKQEGIHSLVIETEVEKMTSALAKMQEEQTNPHAVILCITSELLQTERLKKTITQIRGSYPQLPFYFLLERSGDNEESSDHDPQIIIYDLDSKNKNYSSLLAQMNSSLKQLLPSGYSFFQQETLAIYKMITFPELFDKTSLLELKKLESLLKREKTSLLFNFKLFKDNNVNTHRAIFQFLTSLSRNQILYHSIFIKKQIQQSLKTSNLLSVFQLSESLKAALAKVISVPQERILVGKSVCFDLRIVIPFITAFMNAYQNHLDLILRPIGGPQIEQQYKCKGGSFGILVMVTSERYTGTIVQIFTQDVFKKYIKLLQEKRAVKDLAEAVSFTENHAHDLLSLVKDDLILLYNYEIDEASILVAQTTAEIQNAITDAPALIIKLRSSIGDTELLMQTKITASLPASSEH